MRVVPLYRLPNGQYGVYRWGCNENTAIYHQHALQRVVIFAGLHRHSSGAKCHISDYTPPARWAQERKCLPTPIYLCNAVLNLDKEMLENGESAGWHATTIREPQI